MNGLSFLLPCLILMHNLIDFGSYEGSEIYKNRLNCVITDYIEVIEDQNNIRLINQTGCFGEKIEYLGLQFESTDVYNIEESRKVVLGLIDTFLNTLNGNHYLQPYLPNGKLTSADVEIRIHFIGHCKYNYPNPHSIQYVIFKDGALSYYVVNPRNLSTFEKIKEEPLELSRILAPSVLYSQDCLTP